MKLGDEFQALKAISIEELKEQANEVGYLTPREYAKLRNVRPQQVYGWIRKGVIQSERCKCGRTIIHVLSANKALAKKARDLGRIVPDDDDPELRDEGLRADMQRPLPQAD